MPRHWWDGHICDATVNYRMCFRGGSFWASTKVNGRSYRAGGANAQQAFDGLMRKLPRSVRIEFRNSPFYRGESYYSKGA